MKLYEQLQAHCPCQGDACVIHLQEVTDLEWDRVVFIRMNAIPSKVAAALGVSRIELPEFEDRILFFEGDRILSIDRRIYHPDTPYDRTVFLDFSAIDRNFEVFSRNAAVFSLVCSLSGDRRNIMLVPRLDGHQP